MKIIIIDDNPVFRAGFGYYLQKKMKYDVVASYGDGMKFLDEKLYMDSDIIVLMDVDMPGMDGIEATKRALWRASFVKIIAITAFREKAYLLELIGAGCKGCVFKDNIYDDLETAIKEVIAGRLYFPDNIKLQY